MPGATWSLAQLNVSQQRTPPVTIAELQKIAQLSGLTIPDDRVERAHADVAGLIAWCGQIRHIKTEGVVPMFTPLQQHKLPNANNQIAGAGVGGVEPPPEIGIPLRTRADVVDEGGQAAKVLQNAKRREGSYFVAPKMQDHDDS